MTSLSQEKHSEEMNDQMLIRREKMQTLREQGTEPFHSGFHRTHLSKDLHEAYELLTS